MKQLLVFVCGLLLLLPYAGAEDEVSKQDPVLLMIEKSLGAALTNVEPAPSFEYPKHTKSLVMKYRTRKFMIHNGSMIGRYSDKAHEEEGPSHKGFMLKVHIQKAGTVNQAEVPQTIRGPYWKTDLNITVVEGTDKQLYWGLSYGNRVDQNLLKQVKRVVNALGENNGEPTDSPDEK